MKTPGLDTAPPHAEPADAGASPTAEPAPSPKQGFGAVGLLFTGHVLNDFYATMLNPILVEVGKVYGLSIARTQMLPALIGIFGSVVQPLVGVVGDRMGRRLFIVAGSAAAAVFMCSIGYAPSLGWLLALLVLGAAGVGTFHPTAASTATAVTSNRGLSFAVFLTGGAVGLALAPFVVTRIVAHTHDLRSLAWLGIPGVLVAAAFALFLPRAARQSASRPKFSLRGFVGRGSGVLWLIFLVVTLRSTVFSAFASFMGHLSVQYGWSIEQRGNALSLFLACTAVGGIMGGWLSDRVNRKALLLLSCFAGAPLLIGFALTKSYGHALAMLMPAGVIVTLATPMMVVIAQDLCPSNESAASGMMMGLAWGVAALLLPLLGKLAELPAVKPSGALVAVSSLTAVAGVLSFFLPSLEEGQSQ